MTNWQDTVEQEGRSFLAVTKEQLDYYLIHKEFVYIKKRSLSVYLENEKKNLEKHFYDRTVDLLKNIERIENSNQKNKIREILEESLKALLTKINDNAFRRSLHNGAFKSALEGLRTSNMSYQGDPLIPLLLEEIKLRSEPLTRLTKEEENRMYALTTEQKRFLAESDNRAKIDYLTKPPEVSSASVKNSEIYKGITSRMRRRIESTFKI